MPTLASHAFVLADLGARFAVEYRQYMDAATRWLAGGSFYQPWQLTGPYLLPHDEYRIAEFPVLVPRPSLLPFVPFAAVPSVPVLAAAWWAIPLGIVGGLVWRWRPRRAIRAGGTISALAKGDLNWGG